MISDILLEDDYYYQINLLNEDFLLWYSTLVEDSASSTQWYLKWKVSVSDHIKNAIKHMKEYGRTQLLKDNAWMEKFRTVILNQQAYPVKPQNALRNSPNYELALQRIQNTIGSSLNGIDLEKIDTDNKDNSNGWLKHFLINTYKNGN